MHDNVTIVASIPRYHYCVVVFTIISALFYAYETHKVFRTLSCDKKIYHIIINCTALMMSVGAFFPYTIQGLDIVSKIHVYCSMISCILFLILLFIYTRYLAYENIDKYLKIHYFYDLGLQFLCIFFIVFAKVNGYLEILFACLVSGYFILIKKNDD